MIAPATVPFRATLEQEVALWRFPWRQGERSGPRVTEVLAHYLGAREACAIVRGPHGRPELATQPAWGPLGVSVSHAGDWLVVAVGHGVQPGIDIERCKPRPNALAIARRYFTDAEARMLAGLAPDERERRFYQLWVAREAVVKAIGRGLAFGLDRLAFEIEDGRVRLARLDGECLDQWQVHTLDVPAGYQGALAWCGPPRAPGSWQCAAR